MVIKNEMVPGAVAQEAGGSTTEPHLPRLDGFNTSTFAKRFNVSETLRGPSQSHCTASAPGLGCAPVELLAPASAGVALDLIHKLAARDEKNMFRTCRTLDGTSSRLLFPGHRVFTLKSKWVHDQQGCAPATEGSNRVGQKLIYKSSMACCGRVP